MALLGGTAPCLSMCLHGKSKLSSKYITGITGNKKWCWFSQTQQLSKQGAERMDRLYENKQSDTYKRISWVPLSWAGFRSAYLAIGQQPVLGLAAVQSKSKTVTLVQVLLLLLLLYRSKTLHLRWLSTPNMMKKNSLCQVSHHTGWWLALLF